MPTRAPFRPAAEPEILRPRLRGGGALFSDDNLDMLSHLLDDFLRIPGTNIRFGLDGIVGLIPGIGDILGAMASWIIILAAWRRGVPKITLVRMLVNVAIETILGTVPILGDAFDIAWKANRRNFALLQRATGGTSIGTSFGGSLGGSLDGSASRPGTTHNPADGTGHVYAAGTSVNDTPAPAYSSGGSLRLGPTSPQKKKHALSDWLFLATLFLGMLLLLAIPLVFLAWLAGKFFALGTHR